MSKLAAIIQRKKNEALLNTGKITTKAELPGGLIFRMKREINGKYTIYLFRAGTTPPSEQEAETFIDHWPEAADSDNFTAALIFHLQER